MPCVPANVEVTIDCSNNTAAVTWDEAMGALSYRAVAQSSLGVNSSCESDTPGCTLTGLTCGVEYSLRVIARDDVCSSLPSQPTEFHTGRQKIKWSNLICIQYAVP